MANGYTLTECYYTARQIWIKEVLKRAILRTDEECSPVFFGIHKRFGPMNLFVISNCAFMFKFIIGSHVTNECEPRLYILLSAV